MATRPTTGSSAEGSRDDRRERRLAHGYARELQLVGRRGDGCVVEAARVGVGGREHAEPARGRVHARHEGGQRARVVDGQQRRDVVRRGQQQRLQRLPLADPLAGAHGKRRLREGRSPFLFGDVGGRDRHREPFCAERQRVLEQGQVGGHDLGDARDRNAGGRPRAGDAPDPSTSTAASPSRGQASRACGRGGGRRTRAFGGSSAAARLSVAMRRVSATASATSDERAEHRPSPATIDALCAGRPLAATASRR